MSVWSNFTRIPAGTRIENHKYDQCVALANHYWGETLRLPLPVGIMGAYQWWTTRNDQPNLYRNATFSSKPVPGALFVARYGQYDSVNGHIGVVTSVNADGTFNTMEQNAESNRYVGRYRRNLSNILGFIVPNNNPATPKHRALEEDEMQSVMVDNAHHYGVSNEFITHYATIDQSNITRSVTSATDELHKITGTQFGNLLDGLGIPREVVQAGKVFNPQAGVFERNGTWSRNREVLAALAKLATPSEGGKYAE